MRLDDKPTLKKLREAIDAALMLARVPEMFGLTSLKAGRISYDSNGLSAKITLEAEAKSEDGKSKDEVNFEKYAQLFGLKPEWLRSSFKRGLDSVEIIGLHPNRSKFPVLVRSSETGKNFLITADEVKRKLGAKSAPQVFAGSILVPPLGKGGGA
jgi:hypothetical protein